MTNATDYGAAVSPKLAEIADVIGLDDAIRLCEIWPGVRLFVPKNVGAKHPIALAIGLVAAEKLAKRYGGETIFVPKAEAWRRQQRNAQIVEEYSGGASGRELALKYGLHENYVYELIGKLEAKRHPDLFGGGG